MTIEDLNDGDIFIRWYNSKSFTFNIVIKALTSSINVDSYTINFRGIKYSNKNVGRRYIDDSLWQYADKQTIKNTIIPGVFK